MRTSISTVSKLQGSGYLSYVRWNNTPPCTNSDTVATAWPLPPYSLEVAIRTFYREKKKRRREKKNKNNYITCNGIGIYRMLCCNLPFFLKVLETKCRYIHVS